jgi:DNA polymerase III epsilon subunit-like protein
MKNSNGMDFRTKPIAMTDLETTGDIFSVHEIIEIGLVVFDQKTFEILDTLNIKIKPEHIENAVPAALASNGYKEENWNDAVTLQDALSQYVEKTQNCIFCAYNVSFDWGFMSEAFKQTEIPNHMSTRENHDRLDVLSIAWQAGLKNSPSLSLKSACDMFGIPPEPEPHSALNGALTGFELFKKVV